MRLRICSKIPPVILAALIVSLVIVNKKTTIEKEKVGSVENESAERQNLDKSKRDSNTKEFEQIKEVKQGEEATDITLQRYHDEYKEHMKYLKEKKEQEEQKNAGKDASLENVQDILKNKENVQQIVKDIEPKKETMAENKEPAGQAKTQEQNKEPVAQAKPAVQNKPEVIAGTKVEPKANEAKDANEQAAVKTSENENKVVHDVYSQTGEYLKAIENDVELQESKKTFGGIVTLAQNVLSTSPSPKILLLGFVHEDNAVFANNWLCNAKILDIHSALIIVTYGSESREFLSKKWPTLNLYTIEPNTPEDNLREEPLTLKKLQVIYVLLNAGINVLLLDVESVWFSNPVPGFKSGGTDMLVNRASPVQVNTGFIVLFATEKNKHFWGSLYLKVKEFANKPEVGLEAKYEKLLEIMTIQRFGNVTFDDLPKESYVEGMWYELPSEEREKTRPIVIRNNNLMGFAKRIRRAVTWKHWFIIDEGNCDESRVSKIVKTAQTP